MKATLTQTFQPKGPFDLLFQNQFFNGWPMLSDKQTIVMAFPVEGWQDSAAVTMKQNNDGSLYIQIYGAQTSSPQALLQALAALSLDEDGSSWQQVGEHDPILQELQVAYHYMRPSLFHSPYEATCAFLIGHRISIAQTRKIRQHISEEYGQKFTIEGQAFYAFPDPHRLLKIAHFPGINSTKLERLHVAAQAALDGWLSRAELRKLDEPAALDKLETLPGIGGFFSQGILDRGAGQADGFTYDDLTFHAIGVRYGLGESPSKEQVIQIAEKWHPYRMWAVVLMHVWLRQTGELPKRTFNKR